MTDFDRWMIRVDQATIRLSLVSIYDLSDQLFKDWFNDGVSPEAAARRALTYDGFPFYAIEGDDNNE